MALAAFGGGSPRMPAGVRPGGGAARGRTGSASGRCRPPRRGRRPLRPCGLGAGPGLPAWQARETGRGAADGHCGPSSSNEGNKTRTIPMPPELVRLLRGHLKKCGSAAGRGDGLLTSLGPDLVVAGVLEDAVPGGLAVRPSEVVPDAANQRITDAPGTTEADQDPAAKATPTANRQPEPQSRAPAPPVRRITPSCRHRPLKTPEAGYGQPLEAGLPTIGLAAAGRLPACDPRPRSRRIPLPSWPVVSALGMLRRGTGGIPGLGCHGLGSACRPGRWLALRSPSPRSSAI